MSREALLRLERVDAYVHEEEQGISQLRLVPPLSGSETIDHTNEAVEDALLREGVDRILDFTKKYPVLSAEEEQELGYRIQAGLQASKRAEQGGYKSSAMQQEDELLVIDGRQAHEKFAMSNVKWLAKRARYYYEHHPMGKSYGFEDIFMSGYIGLDHAVKKFDPTLGYKFLTYATPWINNAIERELDYRAAHIKIPLHVRKQMRKRQRLESAGKSPVEQLGEMSVDGAELQELKQLDELGSQLLSLERPLAGEDNADLNVKDAVQDTRASEEFASVTGSVRQELGVAGLASGVSDALCRVLNEPDLELITHIIYGETIDPKRHKAHQRLKKILDHPAVRAELKEFFPGVSESWQDEAACRGEADTYIKPGGDKKNRIKSICGGCAVRGACAAYFDTEKPLKGQWIDGKTFSNSD
jgi:RNA polymerase sigma factor (sigma-70 family)